MGSPPEEVGAWIEGEVTLHLLVERSRLRRARRRQHDLEHDILIPGRLSRKPAAPQAQLAAGLRSRRDAQLHRSSEGGYRDAAPERGLPRGNGKRQSHVASFE